MLPIFCSREAPRVTFAATFTIKFRKAGRILTVSLTSLQAYDAHMNLVLSEVEETVSIVDVSEDGEARGVRVSHLSSVIRSLFVEASGKSAIRNLWRG